MSIKVSLGTKKRTFKSIKEFAEASDLSYITAYMRVRKLGWNAATAMRKPVRKYEKRYFEAQSQAV